MCSCPARKCYVCGILLQAQGTTGGNAVRFLFFLLLCVGCCLLRVFASFSSSKGRFLKSIFGSELLFLVSCCGLWFSLVVFCLCFCLLISFFSPENAW